jgi:hypothetical protein
MMQQNPQMMQQYQPMMQQNPQMMQQNPQMMQQNPQMMQQYPQIMQYNSSQPSNSIEYNENEEKTENNNYLLKEKINSLQIMNLENINKELKEKVNDLQNKIDIINKMDRVDTGCDVKIKKIKNDLTNKINDITNSIKSTTDNYIQLLFNTLLKNQIITQNEIKNIKLRLTKKEIDSQTIISYLEDKIKLSKTIFSPISDSVFNQTNSNNNYGDIFNKKWNVPLPRPPVCISDDPIKVKQNDNFFNNFSNITI